MSIIFQQAVRQNAGSLALNVGDGALVDPVRDQGLAFDDTGAIYATTTTPPVRFAYGLPFDADDRLVVEDAAIDYYSQGIGFTANNALAVSDASGGIDHYNQGIPYASGGGFAVDGLTPPAPPNTIIYAMGASGMEVWRTDVTPYALDNTICPFLGTQAYNVSASQTGNRLAVVSRGATQAIYLYDTSTNPYTLLNTISLAYEVDILAMAPNGQQLVYGASNGARDLIVLDISNAASPVSYVVRAATNVNLGQCVYNQSSDRLLFTGLGTLGYFIFDTSTFPPTQVHFTSGGYDVTAENSLHGYALFEFANLQDLYAFRVSTNAYLGTVDGNFSSRAFLTSPDGLFGAQQKATGIGIRNTTSPTVTNWPLRAIKAGDELPSGDISAVNCFAFSNTSNLLALFQDSNAGDRRIVFDLTTSPIERVTSFDTEPNKDFRDITMVGNFI